MEAPDRFSFPSGHSAAGWSLAALGVFLAEPVMSALF
jgi:membrane-associated phospholipid phosphatase